MLSNSTPSADTLHRLIKQALDNGTATTLAEAEALFRTYRLTIAISAEEAEQPQHQAALLTAVALARRVFLGGVSVECETDVPIRVPLPVGRTLCESVKQLGGAIEAAPGGTPRISIGGRPIPQSDCFHVRTACSGWRGGIIPAHSCCAASGPAAVPLAAMLAAALAINEAFLHVGAGTPSAGQRVLGLSLWHPAADVDWLNPSEDEPALQYLPTRLWLIGLGHLGQAYLWGLGLLNYPDPSRLMLLLQDTDWITPSTESTSILTDARLVGQRKTRAAAAWAERRGFVTSIHERKFDASFKRHAEEPSIALCGIDNAIGRRALDQVGFDLVVEVGLGRGHRDFRTLRLHTLPGSRQASELWRGSASREDTGSRAAYQKMLKDGDLDRCGVTLLAGKAVGAPFVGAVGATLALAEVLRLLHGGRLFQLIDLDLESLEQRLAVLNPTMFEHLNPGFTANAA